MDDRPTLPAPDAPHDGHAAPDGGAAAPAGLPPPQRGSRSGRPWGFWATLGWTALWLAAFLGTGTAICLVAVVVLAATGQVSDVVQEADALAANGLLLGLVAVAQVPIMVGLTALLAWIRMPVSEYLGLRWPGYRQTAVGLVALLVLMVGQDVLSWSLGRPIVAEFMLTAYRTAVFLPVLVVALLVAAPVVEEVFFRGFMYKGLAASKVGPAGAILITSLVWAAIHLQYDVYGMGLIFTMGVLLGLVRWRTKSVILPILLHGMINAVATVQTVVVAEGWA
jgi:hypothetical protein